MRSFFFSDEDMLPKKHGHLSNGSKITNFTDILRSIMFFSFDAFCSIAQETFYYITLLVTRCSCIQCLELNTIFSRDNGRNCVFPAQQNEMTNVSSHFFLCIVCVITFRP